MFDQKKCTEARRLKYEAKCEKIFSKINIEEFKEFYNSHHDKEVQEKFGLTCNQLKIFCEKYSINKSTDRFKLLSYNTRLELYGDGNYRNIQKHKSTKLKRYGDSNYNNSKKIAETHLAKSAEELELSNQKRRNTCLSIYGTEASSQSDVVKNKMMKTNINRYNVPYFCMLPQCRLKSKSNSHINKKIAELFRSYLIEFESEFRLDRYSYDFKVGRYLIEIDPSPYHNITWNPYNDIRIDKDYHLNKSLLAYKNGYICIHIFDWLSIEKILSHIKNNQLEIIRFESPRKYLYDLKLKQLVSEQNENTVEIYDDGVVYNESF